MSLLMSTSRSTHPTEKAIGTVFGTTLVAFPDRMTQEDYLL